MTHSRFSTLSTLQDTNTHQFTLLPMFTFRSAWHHQQILSNKYLEFISPEFVLIADILLSLYYQQTSSSADIINLHYCLT
jgi:hypothetical protein